MYIMHSVKFYVVYFIVSFVSQNKSEGNILVIRR